MVTQITYLDKVSSTNDYVVEIIKKGFSKQGIVLCDKQFKGKGRRGKVWQSLEGNIFCSIYKPVKSYNKIQLAQFSSLDLVKKYLIKNGISKKLILIKEPNDILINNKKVCGILIESIKIQGKVYLIAGIGLNLFKNPKLKEYKTTYLKKYTNKKLSKRGFINYLKEKIRYF